MDKKILYGAISLLLVAGSASVLMKEHESGFLKENNFVVLAQKGEQISDLGQKSVQEDMKKVNLLKETKELSQKEKELSILAEQSNSKKREVMNEFNVETWKINVPSLLVDLDQKAKASRLVIDIDYNALKKEQAPSGVRDNQTKDIQKISNKASSIETTSSIGMKKSTFETYSVPIKLFGKYADVTQYLNSLEKVNLFTIEDLKLSKEEDNLRGQFILRIVSYENEPAPRPLQQEQEEKKQENDNENNKDNKKNTPVSQQDTSKETKKEQMSSNSNVSSSNQTENKTLFDPTKVNP